MLYLETKSLTHRYGKDHLVLDNVNLQVEKGSIYGFLGPNGAGKTTTLRLVLGLLQRQRGEVFVFGKEFSKNRVEVLHKIGSLIETPSFYGHLTAVENLLLLQKVYRCDKTRISEVLQLVGLAKTGTKKVSRFSLGMKQRLGIAIALLHNPSLLVLDEPTNGLDPNGMIEIRELLLRLNREHGITVLISSHLLAEMEKLVTHLGVINKGRIVFQGTLSELNAEKNKSAYVSFETSDIDQTVEILLRNSLSPTVNHQSVFIKPISKQDVARVNRELIGNGIELYEVRIGKNDLETIFMDLINK